MHPVIYTPNPDTLIIAQTANWIKSVVIGCNFCPFAAKAMQMKSIRYVVLHEGSIKDMLTTLVTECIYLDNSEDTETTIIVLPNHFPDFNNYLNLIDKAEHLILEEDYEGIYQLASFHPLYCFEGAPKDDAANYTNRSPFPMLQILREESITKALENFPDPDSIPEKNIEYARKKGLVYMEVLRAKCMVS